MRAQPRPPPPGWPGETHDLRSHHRQTDLGLALGGLFLLLFVGGGILWLFLGEDAALIGMAVLLGAALLMGGLWALLGLLGRWAGGE